MCDRYVLNASGTEIAQALGIPQAPEVTPSFNIPPGTRQWVAHANGEADVVLEQLGWGYRPVWAGQDAPQPIAVLRHDGSAADVFRWALRPAARGQRGLLCHHHPARRAGHRAYSPARLPRPRSPPGQWMRG